MSDAFLSIVRGADPSRVEDWPSSLPPITESYRRLSAFDASANGDPTLLLVDDLRAEDLLTRFRELVEQISNAIDDYSRYAENSIFLDVNISKLEVQLAINDEDLKDFAAENTGLTAVETKNKTSLDYLNEMLKKINKKICKNNYVDGVDEEGVQRIQKYGAAIGRGSFSSIKGTDDYTNASVGQHEIINLSFIGAYTADEIQCRQLKVRKAEIEADNIATAAQRTLLISKETKTEKRKLIIDADLQHLRSVKASRYGASFEERLAAIAVGARQAAQFLDRVGVQMARAFRNVYGGLVDPRAIAFTSTPGWSQNIDQGLVEQCKCLEKYLTDVLYLVRVRSSRAEISVPVTLAKTADSVYEGSISLEPEGATKHHKLPRLRGATLFVDSSLVDRTNITLDIGSSGYRNFTGSHDSSQNVSQENAWPVLIGRPSLAGAPEPVTFHGIASLWNCSIFSDFKITAQVIGEVGEQPISIRLVLDYEYVN